MRATILFSFSLWLGMVAPARAYVRTTVDGVPDLPLFWADRTIDVELASGSSTDVDAARLRSALDAALASWSHAGCTDVLLVDVGEASGPTTNLDGGRYDGHERVVVRENAWPAIAGPETLALTTVVYDRATGAILDADTDLDAVMHAFSVGDPVPSDHDDLENTLTHEMGHLLGFSHSSVPEATMFASAAPGETLKRDLAPDDVRAVCETYPTGMPTPSTPPPAPTAASGCSVSRASHVGIALLGLVVAAALVRAIRRARRGSRRGARAGGTACGAR